nr:hypothetical protein CFP56_38007 [Quercus suber]
MNILSWNCRGAINPNFGTVVSEMIRKLHPAILIISETKVSGVRAKGIIDRIPMDGVIVANSIGLSRGLWVLWDSRQVELTELSSTEQEIHALVTSTAKPTLLLFVVYASPQFAERRLLWDTLTTVAGLHSMPALRFQECLDNCRMIDIGFNGPRFTWSNHRPLSQLIQTRIDRIFVNAEWNDLYPEAAVFHLEKTHSNHCSIRLCFENV